MSNQRKQKRAGGRSSVGVVGEIKSRDPVPVNRDPQPQRIPRRYIPASMPCVCPECGHSTRMADGRHVDPVRKTILEYRTCTWCGVKVAAGRAMTAVEVDQLCSRVDAIREYEGGLV